MAQTRIIETEYKDFPAVHPLTFYGPETRAEYKRQIVNEEGQVENYDFGLVLKERAEYLRKVLVDCNRELSSLLNAIRNGSVYTITDDKLDKIIKVMRAFTSTGGGGGYTEYDDRSGRTTLYRTGRVEKMIVYDDFFNLVWLLHELQDYIANQAKSSNVASRTKNMLKDILRIYPTLLMHLRVTPMGPEPNQVTNMCNTQFLPSYVDPQSGKLVRGSSQRDQCNTVYDMCRGKQDEFGVIDHTRDLLCTRYIKGRVFPDIAPQDPDVRQIFQNYDYARDGSDYLQNYVTQHDWQTEYDLDTNLTQWDTKYKSTDNAILTLSDGTKVRVGDLNINYADRGARQGDRAARTAAMNKLVYDRQTSINSNRDALIRQSQSAYEASQNRFRADQLAEMEAKLARRSQPFVSNVDVSSQFGGFGSTRDAIASQLQEAASRGVRRDGRGTPRRK